MERLSTGLIRTSEAAIGLQLARRASAGLGQFANTKGDSAAPE